ncbi:AsmA family protein [Candidatus Nitrosoglobus terrae]|uniref:AsmA family protein n=1 Tax=Candidatus Nitrosoglobus terrae TaxID=1630141 RepID=A0A1Q2SM34_9GAMM|nr:AsmA family protein [Candidatus Nitrosoglobus terrae]BAW80198.1 AsmA family protein [Candidatus Nitrosoglobus terrae]
MKKFLKILFSTFAVIILLVVIAAVVLPFIINPNDFKPQIVAQVKKITGRELTLDGDIDLSLFPWLGATIQKVSLSNPPNFGDIPFVKVDDMEVRVKLLPLLRKEVEMDTVILSGLDLNLIRNANGETNWEDLTTAKTQEQPLETKPSEGTEPEAPPIAGLAIGGLKIEEARISWQDETQHVNYTIDHLNLETDPLVLGEPTQIKLTSDFSSTQPKMNGNLGFSGSVAADLEANRYQLQNTDIKLTATGSDLPVEQLALQLGADIDAAMADQQIAVNNLKLISQVKSTQFPKPVEATLATAAKVDLNKGTLSLPNLYLTAFGVKLKAQVEGADLLTNPNFSGRIASNQFNPRKVAKSLAIALPAIDETPLNKAQLGLKFSGSPKDFNLQRFIVKLDENILQGAVKGDPEAKQYHVNGLKLNAKVKSPQFPKPLNATLTTGADVDLNKGTISLPNLVLATLGVKLNSQINGTSLLTTPNFSGQINSNQFNPRQVAKALAITLPAAADQMPLEKAELGLKFSGSAKSFDAQHFIVKLDDSTVQGAVKGNLETQQYQVSGLQLNANVKSSQFPDPLIATLTTGATADLKKGTLSLPDLYLAALGVKLNGQINGTDLQTNPNFSGQIDSNSFNPRQVAKALAIEIPTTTDKTALSKAQLGLKFSGTPNSFDAKQLTVKLDQSTLQGTAAIDNFQQPAIRYNLALDTINADRYLPPSSTAAPASAPPVSPGAGAAASASSLPVEELRALNINGLVKIGQLIINNLHTQDISVPLNAKDGLIALNPLSAKLYQGTYAGNMRLDARGQTPQLAIDEKLANIQAGPLLKDFMGDDKLQGLANLNAKLTANGATPEAIKSTLNGTAGFSFTDGAIKGFDIAGRIRQALAAVGGVGGALLSKLSPNNGKSSEKTDFSALKGTITATNGLLQNSDLDIQSPFLRVGGKGSANLVTEALNYQLGVAIVKTIEGQGGDPLTDLKGITIPMKIGGTLSDPKYSFDVANLIKAKGEKLIKEGVQKGLNDLLGTQPGGEGGEALSPEKQLKEGIEKGIKNKLKGLFN